MGMMNEFSAYSWQQQRLNRVSNREREKRGRDGVRERRGVAIVQATILTTGWRGLLAQLHGPVRSVAEKSGEVAYAALDSRLPVYIHPHARIRLERPKQIFGASPLKTRDEPTDELICFPTTLLSSLSFFAYPPLPSPAFRWPSPTPRDAYIAENIRASIWKWLL